MAKISPPFMISSCIPTSISSLIFHGTGCIKCCPIGRPGGRSAWDSMNTNQLDVRCFYEVSRAFDPAVGLETSIPDVQLQPPELRKVAHIPPTRKVSTSIRGVFHILLHKPSHEEVHSASSSCTAPERVRKRFEFG